MHIILSEYFRRSIRARNALEQQLTWKYGTLYRVVSILFVRNSTYDFG